MKLIGPEQQEDNKRHRPQQNQIAPGKPFISAGVYWMAKLAVHPPVG